MVSMFEKLDPYMLNVKKVKKMSKGGSIEVK
jgi:hypothetical protein